MSKTYYITRIVELPVLVEIFEGTLDEAKVIFQKRVTEDKLLLRELGWSPIERKQNDRHIAILKGNLTGYIDYFMSNDPPEVI